MRISHRYKKVNPLTLVKKSFLESFQYNPRAISSIKLDPKSFSTAKWDMIESSDLNSKSLIW